MRRNRASAREPQSDAWVKTEPQRQASFLPREDRRYDGWKGTISLDRQTVLSPKCEPESFGESSIMASKITNNSTVNRPAPSAASNKPEIEKVEYAYQVYHNDLKNRKEDYSKANWDARSTLLTYFQNGNGKTAEKVQSLIPIIDVQNKSGGRPIPINDIESFVRGSQDIGLRDEMKTFFSSLFEGDYYPSFFHLFPFFQKIQSYLEKECYVKTVLCFYELCVEYFSDKIDVNDSEQQTFRIKVLKGSLAIIWKGKKLDTKKIIGEEGGANRHTACL